MTKVLVCGDWHGSAEAARATAKEARRQNCRVIVQVGDFGFWPHTDPDYVMFTHDMPDGTDLGITLHHDSNEDGWNRKAVRAVVDKVKPARLYHGHYHHAKQTLLRIDGAPPVEINSPLTCGEACR